MKKFFIHIIHVLLFAAITFFYCFPIIDGKVVDSGDFKQFKGMSQEIEDYREDTGEEALWTNRMFGGMPTFHMGVKYPNNILLPVDQILQLGFPRPVGMIFICFIGFYILLLALKLDLKIAFLGALAFGFSSYLYIIIGAGHNTKVHAIAYMAPTIAAMIFCYRDKRLLGFFLTFLFLGLQIRANHYQISYYLLFLLFAFWLYEIFLSVNQKEFKNFIKNTGIFSLGCLFAILINIPSIWSTYDYSKYSTRGGSDVVPEICYGDSDESIKNNQNGLDFDYATMWSYGKLETFNLIIPNLYGGSSHSKELSDSSAYYKELDKTNSVFYNEYKKYNKEIKLVLSEISNYKEAYKASIEEGDSLTAKQIELTLNEYRKYKEDLEKAEEEYKEVVEQTNPDELIKNSPMYWGGQPMTSGPVYIGSIVFFLFFLGLIIINDRRIKTFSPSFTVLGWLLFGLTILSIFLSWGYNFGWLSHLFFDYFPLYAKFRSVTMILVIVEITIPIIAVLGLSKFLDQVDKNSKKYSKIWQSKLIYLLISFSIIVVICFAFLVSGFDFISESDRMLVNSGYRSVDENNAIIEGRRSLFFKDIFRTLLFVLLAVITLILFLIRKINRSVVIYLLALFILLDMWFVNKRYLNNDNFSPQKEVVGGFENDKNDVDFYIEEDTSHYRVFNIKESIFGSARTSYFHNNLGGYHAAKLSRPNNVLEYIESYRSGLDQSLNQIKLELDNFRLDDGSLPQDIKNELFSLINNELAPPGLLLMLNPKHIIYEKEAPKDEQIINELLKTYFDKNSLNNAWFIENVQFAENSQDEFCSILDFNPKRTVIINNKDSMQISQSNYLSNNAQIDLISFNPNQLVYKSNSDTTQLAVFSEIYYPKGWNAYIDGEKVPYFCANYILRALEVPKGEHTITFKFEPHSFYVGNNIALASSIIFILTFISLFFPYFRRKFPLLKK